MRRNCRKRALRLRHAQTAEKISILELAAGLFVVL
jgi:hypothetical protein